MTQQNVMTHKIDPSDEIPRLSLEESQVIELSCNN